MELIPLLLTFAFCIASWCYPWKDLHTARGVIALQLPWAAVICYVVYELMMRPYNIRLDALFVLPVLAVVGVVTLSMYVRRMVRLLQFRRPGDSASSP